MTQFFFEDFDEGDPAFRSNWSFEGTPASFFLVSDGSGGNALSLKVTSSSSGPNASSELASVFNNPPSVHSGYQAFGEDTWYNVDVRFPSGLYIPTTGEWNWLIEWHTDGPTQSLGGNSCGVSVITDYPVTSSPGVNPRLRFRVAGGNPANPTYVYLPSSNGMSSPLIYDHWYRLKFHIIWRNDASGLAEWWVDNVLQGSRVCQTLYTLPDGSHSYNSFGLYNYRLHATWASEAWFDNVIIGSDQASVTVGGGFSGTAPTVATSAASSVTGTTATLNGTVNPNSQTTSYHFEYGLTQSYGSNTTPASAGAGSSPIAENTAISGLTAGRTYHYRIVATNAGGSTLGSDVTFSTSATPIVNITPPVISGIAQVGYTLTSSRGTWTGTPTVYTYQWKRETGLNTGIYANIGGETNRTYVCQSADIDRRLEVDVAAS